MEKNSIKNELQPDTGIESDGVKLVFDQELQHIKEELEVPHMTKSRNFFIHSFSRPRS